MFAGIFASSMQPLIDFVDTDVDVATRSTYTASMDFGQPDAARRLVAFIGVKTHSFTGVPNFDSVTIGGSSASQIETLSRGDLRVGVYSVPLTAGTSGSVVVALDRNSTCCNIAMFSGRRLKQGVVASEIDDGGGSSQTITILVTASGGVCAAMNSEGGGFATTWTGLVADFDLSTGEGDRWSGAHRGFLSGAAAYSVTASQGHTDDRLLAAVSLF